MAFLARLCCEKTRGNHYHIHSTKLRSTEKFKMLVLCKVVRKGRVWCLPAQSGPWLESWCSHRGTGASGSRNGWRWKPWSYRGTSQSPQWTWLQTRSELWVHDRSLSRGYRWHQHLQRESEMKLRIKGACQLLTHHHWTLVSLNTKTQVSPDHCIPHLSTYSMNVI